MKAVCLLLLTLVAATLLAAPPVNKPNIRIDFPHYVYESVIATSIEAINFRKFEFREFVGKKVPEGIRLTDGKASVPDPKGGTDDIMLRRVSYFGMAGKPQYALAEFIHFGTRASSIQDGIIQVYAVQNDHPVVLQQIVFDAQAEGWGIDFDPKTNTLQIRGRANDGTPHCCPKFLDNVTFKWRAGKFAQTAYTRTPIVPK